MLTETKSFKKVLTKAFASVIIYSPRNETRGFIIRKEVLYMRAMNEDKLEKLAEYIKQYARELEKVNF